MEEGRWKKDETPYLIFRCSKCQQYSYVKTTQKTKKCLRCNRTHQVQNLLRNGEIVKGMTAAVERVKLLQNELAEIELGRTPDLVSNKGFSLPKNNDFIQANENPIDNDLVIGEEKDYYPAFLEMLGKLKTMYKTFPRYLIDIMAESISIPLSELPLLIRKALREDRLAQKNELFSLSS